MEVIDLKIVNLLDYPKVNISKVSVASTATSAILELVVHIDVLGVGSRTVVNAEEVGFNIAV